MVPGWQGLAGLGLARRGRHGTAWQGVAWRGEAWQGRHGQYLTTTYRRCIMLIDTKVGGPLTPEKLLELLSTRKA